MEGRELPLAFRFATADVVQRVRMPVVTPKLGNVKNYYNIIAVPRP